MCVMLLVVSRAVPFARRLLMLLLVVVATAASATGASLNAMFMLSGEHLHSSSLTIENGDLHVVLRHDGGRIGFAIESPDHNLRVSDRAVILNSSRPANHGAMSHLVGILVIAASDGGVARSTAGVPLKVPPQLPSALSTILRI